jgi:hypothetical protein
MRPQAADTFRDSPYYRRDAFRAGLRRAGFDVGHQPKANPDPRDVLLIWNRSPANEVYASRYEKAGARVIVAENGYIGTDSDGHILYALALNQHLGAGKWRDGAGDRWGRLGLQLSPWRRSGTEIVVLPQRGIGAPGVAMPREWPLTIVERLRKVTDRPIRVRPHPGKEKTDPFFDLTSAWAAVTWASGAGIKSIVYGVPVFHELKSWIGAPAARFGIDNIENPFLGDRLPMLRRLAYAQWTLAEIQSGEAFSWLLS